MAVLSAIPGLTKIAQTVGDVIVQREKWKAIRDVGLVAIPVVGSTTLGLSTIDYYYTRQQEVQLERIEKAAREAGDEEVAADARLKMLELVSREGLPRRIFSGAGRTVDTAISSYVFRRQFPESDTVPGKLRD